MTPSSTSRRKLRRRAAPQHVAGRAGGRAKPPNSWAGCAAPPLTLAAPRLAPSHLSEAELAARPWPRESRSSRRSVIDVACSGLRVAELGSRPLSLPALSWPARSCALGVAQQSLSHGAAVDTCITARAPATSARQSSLRELAGAGGRAKPPNSWAALGRKPRSNPQRPGRDSYFPSAFRRSRSSAAAVMGPPLAGGSRGAAVDTCIAPAQRRLDEMGFNPIGAELAARRHCWHERGRAARPARCSDCCAVPRWPGAAGLAPAGTPTGQPACSTSRPMTSPGRAVCGRGG